MGSAIRPDLQAREVPWCRFRLPGETPTPGSEARAPVAPTQPAFVSFSWPRGPQVKPQARVGAAPPGVAPQPRSSDLGSPLLDSRQQEGLSSVSEGDITSPLRFATAATAQGNGPAQSPPHWAHPQGHRGCSGPGGLLLPTPSANILQ